jgi:peptidoglycan/LPS O-acetylase OafA/YrhL
MRFTVTKTGDDGKNLRVDLQGLRGFGVLLVIVGHLWLWPPGGFAALDIFFVLSGYFISAVLIDQFRRSRTLRFREFYLARARRLAPTALTVIAVSIVLTYYLYTPEKGDEVARQGFWAAVFGSNWYFIKTGTSYFAHISDSPLVHYWSLSVEEQFYLAWPLLIWVALRFARRRGWSASRVMFTVFGSVTVAFFGYSMWHSTASPIAAYYSTFDRVWEFGVGGLLAVGRPWLMRIPPRVGTALGWTTTVALAASLGVLHYGDAFPAPWGLLPVLACAGLIAAGVSGRATAPFLVTNVPMVYLGTISYSLYLWHLPVNFFLRSYFIDDTTLYKVVALTVGLLLSMLSFHLLERPLRRAPWLMTRRERRKVRRKPDIDLRPVKLGWLAVVAIVTSAALVLTLRPDLRDSALEHGHEVSAPSLIAGHGGSAGTKSDRSPEQRQLDRIDTALAQTRFPSFSPPLRDLSTAKVFQQMAAAGCTNVTLESFAGCRFGSDRAAKHAVVIGDSIAMSYMAGIREALEPEGWSVQQFTLSGCPAWTFTNSASLEDSLPGCADHQSEAVALLRSERPDLVILASATDFYIAGARSLRYRLQGAALAHSALSRTLAVVKPLAKRLVVLESPPPHRSLQDCITRFSSPSDCRSLPSADWETGSAGEQGAATDYGVQYIATRAWFCDGSCPAFMGSTPVTADGSHLTVQFSRSLAAVLRDALLGQRGGRRPAGAAGSPDG